MLYVKCNEVWNVKYEWWNMWNVMKFEMWIMNDEICEM